VEAKKKGGALKATDTDPSSYLDLEALRWANRRQLIYLIDEDDRNAVTSVIHDPLQTPEMLPAQNAGRAASGMPVAQSG
jgi:hypothetical protein